MTLGPSLRQRIYQVVRRIPKGKVATYGQIARLARIEGHARQVGYALHSLPAESDIPWHRVINARGGISLPGGSHAYLLQRTRLEEEGVEFDARGTVDLSKFGWR